MGMINNNGIDENGCWYCGCEEELPDQDEDDSDEEYDGELTDGEFPEEEETPRRILAQEEDAVETVDIYFDLPVTEDAPGFLSKAKEELFQSKN